jgi:hypothetical protein
MSVHTIQQEKIVDYLLGKFDSNDEALGEIEAQIIEDPEFLRQIEEFETDLIDQYLHHELPPEQAAHFARRYHTPVLKQKLDDLSQLQGILAKERAGLPSVQERWRNLGFTRFRAWALASALAACSVTGFFIAKYEIAQRQGGPAPSVVTVSLAEDGLLSEQTGQRIVSLAPGTGLLRVLIPIRPVRGSVSVHAVVREVDKTSGEITPSGVSVSRRGSGDFAVVDLAAKQLESADYIVSVTVKSEAGSESHEVRVPVRRE